VKVTSELVQMCAPSLFEKYSTFLARSYVETNVRVRWCPRPGCSNAVKCSSAGQMDMRCSCGYLFCFQCNREAHAPASCEELTKWIKQSTDDGETVKWIQVNTKDCPKCQTAIEKNGGCNHMTCRKCTHEFCWLCFGDWRGHQCNAPAGGLAMDPNISEARKSLENYVHYYTRFTNHELSKNLEANLEQDVRAKEEQLASDPNAQMFGVEFVADAAAQLIECRRVLKYTYVAAFYVDREKDGPFLRLFEFNQAELEAATEALSELLEKFTGVETRQQLVNATSSCRTRLKNLMGFVKDRNEGSGPGSHQHNQAGPSGSLLLFPGQPSNPKKRPIVIP
jgi:ariadne-1